MKVPIVIALLCFFISNSYSQCAGWTGFQTELDSFTNPIFSNCVAARLDRLNRDFLYYGGVHGGLKIFDIGASVASQVAQFPPAMFGGNDVTNVLQDSNLLYLALGNFWASDSSNNRQPPGLAIVDISSPVSPVILDYYLHPGDSTGSAAVQVRDSLAYLVAMESGLIILNISNPSSIQFVGQVSFSNAFPHSASQQLPANFYNARGIALQGNHAFVCYDRGGLRVVDISDPSNPVQVSQYVYAPLIDHATAYNSIIIHDTVAFVSLDYYGMEILSIADPLAIYQLAYWRPGDWPAETNNYFVWKNSNGHANELAFDPACDRLYFSGGRSDAFALSVTDPSSPDSCERYGTPADNYGTWGLDFYQGRLALAYIWSEPFLGLPNLYYPGFRILGTPDCNAAGVSSSLEPESFNLFPNPFEREISLRLPEIAGQVVVEIFDLQGRMVWKEELKGTAQALLKPDLPRGQYCLMVTMDGRKSCKHVVRW